MASAQGSPTLRDRILGYLAALRAPVPPEELDQALTRAEREKLSHLAFLEVLLGEQATRRRERAIERRIHEAHFAERATLEAFDWEFNKNAIDRVQFEQLATGDFIRRRENLVIIGESGIGKSHLMQAVGIKACALGFRVRYTTSAALLRDLTASLADKTLPEKLRAYTRPPLLILDEFGFERLERQDCPQAASLLYKVIDLRHGKQSTALVTNVDFEAWPGYLGDPPLAMAFMDRLVDGAIIMKIREARSFRANRSRHTP